MVHHTLLPLSGTHRPRRQRRRHDPVVLPLSHDPSWPSHDVSESFGLPRAKTFPFYVPLCLHKPISLRRGLKPRSIILGFFPIEREDATHKKFALERNVPCPPQARPLAADSHRVTFEIVFLAGGWHTCAGSRAARSSTSQKRESRYLPFVWDVTACQWAS